MRQTQEFLLFPESSQLLPADAVADAAEDQELFPSSTLPPVFDPTTESWLHRLEGMAGQVVDGRYRIIALLGIGGMGAVYEAEHVEIGRRMAIKILHSVLVEHAVTVARFREEARAAMRINHPNVVEVTDAGITEDRRAYFVMELLRGENLSDLVDQAGSMSPPRALHITLQICRALQVAHGVGIVHRDLKPGNIILTQPQGHPDLVKIFDFGIAKNMAATSALTFPGVAMGTPCYMAPEQVVGQPVDHTIDIYAAGTMLFEMLTGRLPHEGKTVMQLLRRKISLAPVSPREYLPELPVELEAVILRSLAIQAKDRFQTMSEFADALEELATAEHWSAETWDEVTEPEVEETTRRIALEEQTLVVSRRKLLIRRQARSSPGIASDPAVGLTPQLTEERVPSSRWSLTRWLALGSIIGVMSVVFPGPPTPAVGPGPVSDGALMARHGAAAAPGVGVAQLLEWARYAALGGRLVQPHGDNVFDLLGRVETAAPKNPAAAALRGELCSKLERKIGLAILGRQYGEAKTMIQAWSKLDPGDPRLGRSLVRLNLLQGRDALDRRDPALALSFVQEAQGLVQQDPRIDELMGDIHQHRQEHTQARRYYQRALEGADGGRSRRLRRKIKETKQRRSSRL